MNIHVCAGARECSGVHVPVEARRQPWEFFLRHHLPSFWIQLSHRPVSHQEPRRLTSKPQGPTCPCLCHFSTEVIKHAAKTQLHLLSFFLCNSLSELLFFCCVKNPGKSAEGRKHLCWPSALRCTAYHGREGTAAVGKVGHREQEAG